MSLQAPIGCDTVWEFSSFWWPCQFWGVLVRYIIDYPMTGIYLTFFSRSDWGYGFWRGRPQKCHFHHVPSTCFPTGYWPCSPTEGVFAKFLHCKVALFPCFLLSSLKEVTTCSSRFREWGILLPPSLKAEYLCNLFEILLHERFGSSLFPIY